MTHEITILRKISDKTEIETVFKKLLAAKGNIYLKDRFDRNLPLKISTCSSDSLVHCKTASFYDIDFSHSEVFTAYFSVGPQNYMFETRPLNGHDSIALSVGKFFHLQKRTNIRYSIPQNQVTKLLVNYVNGETARYELDLTDINATGCGASIDQKKTALHVDDLIDGEIHFAYHPPVSIQGVVKNFRPGANEKFIIGMEFHHQFYNTEPEIVAIITALAEKKAA